MGNTEKKVHAELLELRTAELSSAALRAFEYAVERSHFSPDGLAYDLGLAVSEAEETIAELVNVRLLQPAHGRSGEFSCVSPESAAFQLLAPLEHQLREQQLAIDTTRTQLLELLPTYEAGRVHRNRSMTVEVVTDLDSVLRIIGEAASACQEEVLTSQPGGGRRAGVVEEASTRDETLLRRGVAIRSIYQHTARYSPPTLAYVERVSRLGSEVRTTSDSLMRMIIFDRATGIIELQGNTQGAVIVREPNILAFMVSAFERAWVSAERFPSSFRTEDARAVSQELQETIMRLLAEGLEDKAVARRLGMSERTCQRHFAKIMESLGAKTRFQAGYFFGSARPEADEPSPGEATVADEPSPSVPRTTGEPPAVDPPV